MKRWKLFASAGLAAVMIAGGCYHKVVGAQGYGADRVELQEGNMPPEAGSRTLGYPKYQLKQLPGQ